MDATRYRPDIDGLRTVAVLSVVLFHLDVPGFSGGYVGVDVFFVISGFLITRLIVDEVEATGQFSFARFYVRRIRRLVPALLSTAAGCLIAATLLFSPEDMERFCRSVAYALLSVSNFHFWSIADYFDTDALAKPLLHTWSLSVEEQFYIIWPAALSLGLLRLRPALLASALVMIALASLVFAEVVLRRDASAAYYLLPSRIVEFMAGAAVVWLIRARPAPGWAADALLFAGLALIAYAVFAFTPQTPFPGLTSLVPCAGAALAIYAGQAPHAGAPLRSVPVVAIGRWSYSIYLVHWPLIVFYTAYTFAETSGLEKVGLVAASVGLGWLQYRLVEQTFRHEGARSWARPRFVGAVAAFAALLIVPTSVIASNDGWTWRIPTERLTQTNREARSQVLKRYCREADPAKPADLFTCQQYRGKDRDIIIWGDSHALHLVPGFAELYPDHNIYVFYLSGCVPQSGLSGYLRTGTEAEASKACVERNKKALAYLKDYKASTIVLSNAKRSTPQEIAVPTREILEALNAKGHHAFVLGDFIRPGRHLVNCTSVPAWFVSLGQLEKRCVGDSKKIEEEIAYNVELAQLVTPFVNPNDLQCPGGHCQFIDGTALLFRDDHHLSAYGAIYFLKRLKDRLPIDGG